MFPGKYDIALTLEHKALNDVKGLLLSLSPPLTLSLFHSLPLLDPIRAKT
jgi:hypothetical protein